MDSFGERVKELRKERNLNQQQFADKVGLSPSGVGSYERGDRQPNYDILIKLADFFNVSADYLLCRTNDKRTTQSALKENSCELKELIKNNSITFNGIEISKEVKRRIIGILTGYFWIE